MAVAEVADEAQRAPRSAPLDEEKSASGGIRAFDCTSTLETKLGESLRSFALGGPGGAAWNVYDADLLCQLEFEEACATTARARLLLGGKVILTNEESLTGSGTRSSQFIVPASAWQTALEGSEMPYETLLFVVRVDGYCEPTEEEPAWAFHWTDGFIAGFSGGE